MYELISRNKRNSWLLLAAIFAVACALGTIFGMAAGDPNLAVSLTLVAALIAFASSLFSYFVGPSMIMAVSRAKKIQKSDHPQLWNVVEELSLAAGTPLPEIYIIEDTAPNAFATGRNPKNAKVAITTGLLTKLTRDELQGVMAHELSHVQNYDILFATLVTVLVGMIALLCDFFLRSFRFHGGSSRRSSSSKESGGGQALVLIIALFLAILAPLAAKLVQLAISRQREYLADASGALLTRYPEGLARALEKIAGDKEVLEAANRATAPLYIVNPIKSFEKRAQGLFSTHPPIEDRIHRLRQMR
jgi:heat shock protein HtpX